MSTKGSFQPKSFYKTMTTRTIILVLLCFRRAFTAVRIHLKLAPWPMDGPRAGDQRKEKRRSTSP